MLESIFRKKDINRMLSETKGTNDGLRRNLSAANLITLGIGAIVGTGIFVITGTAAAN